MTVVLGIDPGSRITGYGIVAYQNREPFYQASGCIKTTATSHHERLLQIYDSLVALLQQYAPTQAAIEQVFMHINVSSALKLGQARGAAMIATAKQGLPLCEYSARQVKQAVVGYGAASKSQVQHMVCQILSLSAPPKADAADALAIALCHGQSLFGLGMLNYKNAIDG